MTAHRGVRLVVVFEMTSQFSPSHFAQLPVAPEGNSEFCVPHSLLSLFQFYPMVIVSAV